MRDRARKAAAVGAAAFVLAGSASLATPGTAEAETKQARCGGSVTAKPGDRVVATTPLLGVPLDLGIVSQATTMLTGTINAILGTVCKVTVQVVDTVVAPVPVVGGPAAEAINGGVAGTTGAVTGALAGGSNEPAPGERPNQPAPGDKPGSGGHPGTGGPGSGPGIPAPNSPPVLGGAGVPGFAALPTDFSTGFAPMRDYSRLPMATAGLYAPSPGLRYGSQIPGYAPKFGILGQDDSKAPPDGIRNAGDAQALPGAADTSADGATLPLLLAVVALAGASGALVRTWVLRRA